LQVYTHTLAHTHTYTYTHIHTHARTPTHARTRYYTLNHPNAEGEAGNVDQASTRTAVLQQDAFLVFRALCKLSTRTSDTAAVQDATAARCVCVCLREFEWKMYVYVHVSVCVRCMYV
jgi:hypothetical protein